MSSLFNEYEAQSDCFDINTDIENLVALLLEKHKAYSTIEIQHSIIATVMNVCAEVRSIRAMKNRRAMDNFEKEIARRNSK